MSGVACFHKILLEIAPSVLLKDLHLKLIAAHEVRQHGAGVR